MEVCPTWLHLNGSIFWSTFRVTGQGWCLGHHPTAASFERLESSKHLWPYPNPGSWYTKPIDILSPILLSCYHQIYTFTRFNNIHRHGLRPTSDRPPWHPPNISSISRRFCKIAESMSRRGKVLAQSSIYLPQMSLNIISSLYAHFTAVRGIIQIYRCSRTRILKGSN